jgi:hypothetical protein
MYVGMPIRFTGTGFGGVSANTDYYVHSLLSGGTKLRLASVLGGPPLPGLTNYPTGPGDTNVLTIVPRTVITTSNSSQTVAGASGLTLTMAKITFPTTFQVSSDVNKIRIVDAWTVDGGTNIFLKYIGEFA